MIARLKNWIVIAKSDVPNMNLTMGIIRTAGMPKNTYEYQDYKQLAESFGFIVVVMSLPRFEILTKGKHGRITYEKAHYNVWTQLRKRGKLLASRRKAHHGR